MSAAIEYTVVLYPSFSTLQSETAERCLPAKMYMYEFDDAGALPRLEDSADGVLPVLPPGCQRATS